jgi:16S rRNA (cytidine1402-2'-O)-methyltransferase
MKRYFKCPKGQSLPLDTLMTDKKHTLILLTTPIGNIQDITLRAKSTLESAQTLVAEDTRKLKDLLSHLGISFQDKFIYSFHEHSGEKGLEKVRQLLNEQDVVFVSDAGSPMVSDPAYPLVQMCMAENFVIDSIAGISSLVMAMELSGLRPLPMHFHGFLPRDKGKKKQMLEMMAAQSGSHYFFEGVSRVEQTLSLLAEVLPDVNVAVMREMTKKFQSVYRFKAGEFLSQAIGIEYRGEFVIGIESQSGDSHVSISELKKQANQLLAKGAKPKDLAKLLAAILDRPVKEVYQELSH